MTLCSRLDALGCMLCFLSQASNASPAIQSAAPSSSGSEPAQPAAVAGPEQPGGKKRKRAGAPTVADLDPDRVQLTEDLTPVFKKFRAISKHYYASEASYNSLTDFAKETGMAFETFKPETETRWNVMQLSWGAFIQSK